MKPLSETLKDEKKLLSYTLDSEPWEVFAYFRQSQKPEITHTLLIRTWVIRNACVCVCVCLVSIGVGGLILRSDVAWIDCIFISFLGESSSILAY